MGIKINIDVMMARRKIGLTELAGRIDITPANLSILKNNKAKAVRFSTLEAICRELEIPPSQAIAFGDHELDIPLIEAAGVGVAMGNAIPLLKEKADFVTKTNDEAGVAFALERFLKS